MAFATPYVFTALELLTAAKMNAIQDNISALWVGTTAGDMDYYVSSTAKQRLAIGASGYYLTSTGTAPAWSAFYRYQSWLLNTDLALNTGDDAVRFRIPAALNGWNIATVAASRKSGTGVLTIQIRNVTDAVDILTTKLTVDSGETDSSTAAAAAVINTAVDDVATGDQFAIDVDVAGTSTLYAFVEIGFLKP